MLELALEYYSAVLTLIIWIAIAIFFFKSGGVEKLKIILIVAGFFLITGSIDFYYAQLFVVIWLILTGIELMISKESALLLVVIAALLPLFGTIWFELIGLTIYSFVIFGFVNNAFKMLVQGEEFDFATEETAEESKTESEPKEVSEEVEDKEEK